MEEEEEPGGKSDALTTVSLYVFTGFRHALFFHLITGDTGKTSSSALVVAAASAAKAEAASASRRLDLEKQHLSFAEGRWIEVSLAASAVLFQRRSIV